MKTCKTCDFWVDASDVYPTSILQFYTQSLEMKCCENHHTGIFSAMDLEGSDAVLCAKEDFGCVKHSDYVKDGVA